MRTLIRLTGALVLAAAVGYFIAPPGMRAHGDRKGVVYNSATEVSVSGTLAQPPARGRMGLYLSLEENDGDMVNVRVAPRAYLAARGLSLAQGDELEVTGSKVMLQGAPVLIAREVTKKGKTLPVRDREGRPLWQ